MSKTIDFIRNLIRLLTNTSYDNFFIIIGGYFYCTFLPISQMNLSDREIKCFNLKNKKFIVMNHESQEEEKVIVREIKFSDDILEKVSVVLEKEDGTKVQIDNFFTLETLVNAKEI